MDKLGYLDYVKDGKKDLVKLTPKGKELFSAKHSDVNPNIENNSDLNPNHYVGFESENNSDINPTYNTTKEENNNTDNIKNKQKESPTKNLTPNKRINKKDEIIYYLKSLDLKEINKVALNEWMEYKEFNYKNIGVNKLLKMLKKHSFEIQQEIVDKSIMNNYKGLFEIKQQNNQSINTKQYLTRNEKNAKILSQYFDNKKTTGEIIEDVEVIN